MKLTATCATCGKPWKSVHIALPIDPRPEPGTTTPTLNNCRFCGGRGVYLVEEAPSHAG